MTSVMTVSQRLAHAGVPEEFTGTAGSARFGDAMDQLDRRSGKSHAHGLRRVVPELAILGDTLLARNAHHERMQREIEVGERVMIRRQRMAGRRCVTEVFCGGASNL